MNSEDITKNYHSYISEIKDNFDPIIKKMREQNNQNWKGKAWKGPINQFFGYTKHFKVFSTIKWATLPIIGPVILALTGWYNKMPVWSLVLMVVVLLFAIYYIYVRNYIEKMATLGCPEFHVGALKTKRPEEYRLWQSFIQKDDFTFNGLYAAMNSLLAPQKDNSINNVIHYSMGREEQLENTIQDLQSRIEEYDQTMDSLVVDVEKSDNAISYLVNLITIATTNLYRLTNNALVFDDMRLVTPFTIYSYSESESLLRKIQDVGTSASSPAEMDITRPLQAEYAVISAALSGTEEAFVDNPYPGRYVVAFSMKMLKSERWVWCFHFDDSDERALSLVLSNDIIETRQIRRLIHAFCLILHTRMISKEEAAEDANQKLNAN
jgi:hypothetical protein